MGRGFFSFIITGIVLLVLGGGFEVRAAPSGGIRGRVLDLEFEVPLDGVPVRVSETGAETETVDGGHFVFENLTPGTYALVFDKAGFKRVIESGVVVTPGTLAEVSVSMPGEYVDMNEMVVRPLELGGSTEIGLLNLRAENIGIMDAIGSDLMSKAGAGSAAEAVKLVSGASVQDGKYAVIRGLSDRFVNTRLNGVAMPTADPDVRAVQLDLFPSAMLDSVQVHKTFTPDLPANTSGGMVDIVTRSIPDGEIFEVKAGTAYNSQATGNDDFLTYRNGGVDYWGVDEGNREKTLESGEVLPLISKPRGGHPNFDNPDPTPAEEERFRHSDAQVRSFNDTIGTSRDTAPVDHSWEFTYGDRLDLDSGASFGWLGTMNYKNSFSYFDDGQDKFKVSNGGFTGFEIPVESGEGNESPDPDQWKMQEGTETVRWGVGGMVGFEKDEHELTLSYLRTQHAEDTASVRWDDETNENLYWHNQSLIYRERSMDSLQLRGENPLTFMPQGSFLGVEWMEPVIDWSLADNASEQNEPDRRFFLAAYNPSTGQWGGPRKPKNFAERAWRKIIEENRYADLNLRWPFRLGPEREGEFKTGLAWNDVDRSYTQDSFYYTAPSIMGARTPYAVYTNATFDDLWSDVFLEDIRLGYPPPYGEGREYSRFFGYDSMTNEVNWMIKEFSDDVDYTGTMDVHAKYLMGEMPVTPWLKVIGGARWEHTELHTEVHAADGNDQQATVLNVRLDPETPDFVSPDSMNTTLDELANADIEQLDILPSLGFILGPFHDVKLRGTWSRTIGRPTFKEITPVSQQESLNGQQFAGNPGLEISQLENYDLRLEWLPSDGQVLSVSGFYKDIQDPIDYAQRPAQGSTPYIIPFNFDEGEVLGVEFEIRQNLGRWFEWLEGFSIGGNATFLDATVAVPDRDVRKVTELLELRGKDPGKYEIDERPMKNQPEYIFNAYFLFENRHTGTSAGIFWNRKGDTLIAGDDANGADYIASLVQLPHNSMNISFSQKFREHWKLSLKAENILNPTIREVWRSDYIPEDAVATSYREGVTYSLSLSRKW
ncbi:TonB-dependent receptor [Kiritimatiella glycovorans]|uniref:TonB-dependent receptor n=2 Tax=Kiritimatiella glycovorans TaxID=1307763 RepID=A0A0G3EJ52_9BACT|nr:TonB-dependent receptor [Kiritimatiella glycovorans]